MENISITKEQIMKTEKDTFRILKSLDEGKNIVVVINGVSMLLEKYLIGSNDYALDKPFKECASTLVLEANCIEDYDDSYTTSNTEIIKFVLYMEHILMPKFEKYELSTKYRYVYKLQYNSNDNSIDMIRYVEEIASSDGNTLYYREIENMNKGIQAVNREYFNKPMLKLNTETKELTATLWTYENKMRTAKNILRLYIESPLTYIIQDLIIE